MSASNSIASIAQYKTNNSEFNFKEESGQLIVQIYQDNNSLKSSFPLDPSCSKISAIPLDYRSSPTKWIPWLINNHFVPIIQDEKVFFQISKNVNLESKKAALNSKDLTETETQALLEIEKMDVKEELKKIQFSILGFQNIGNARLKLCSLAFLKEENFLTQILHRMNFLFKALVFRYYDIKNNQYKEFFELETKLNQVIEYHIKIGTSVDFLLALLNIYQHILERLWLMPFILKNCDSKIVQEKHSLINSRPDQWMKLLSEQIKLERELKINIDNIRRSIKRIFEPSKADTSDYIKERAFLLGDPELGFINDLLGDIYHSVSDYRRAIYYYKQSLEDVLMFEERSIEIEPQILEQEKEKIYSNLAAAYSIVGEPQLAIECLLKLLKTSKVSANNIEIYEQLKNSYFSLENYEDAINYSNKIVELAQVLKNSDLEGTTYIHLGCAYGCSGDHLQAITYFQKALNFFQDNPLQLEKIYGNLSLAYNSCGRYQDAAKCLEKIQKIKADNSQNQSLPANPYSTINLGNLLLSVGESQKALQEFQKVFNMKDDLHAQGLAYIGIGNVYHQLTNYDQAVANQKKALEIAESLNNLDLEEKACGNLGNSYNFLEKYDDALTYLKRQLSLVKEGSAAQATAYLNLGVTYVGKKDFAQAVYFFKKALQVGENTLSPELKGNICSNLGMAYIELCNQRPLATVQSEIIESEIYFLQSIKIYKSLQQTLVDNNQWKIALFEKQILPYRGLENILLQQEKNEQALVITDSRRSQALVSSLLKKAHPSLNTQMIFKEMQTLAQKLKTTFVIYSLLGKDKKNASAWVIDANGNMFYEPIPFDQLPEDMKEASKVFKTFPFSSVRPTMPGRGEDSSGMSPISFLEEMEQFDRDDDKKTSSPSDKESSFQADFNKRLTQWYKVFISPIEQYLPKDPEQTVTIVPDSFLSQIPFAIFRDIEGKYLIEKHPISIAPSLKVLQLLDQIPQEIASASIAIGNPKIPKQVKEMEWAEKEAKKVATFFLNNSPDSVLTQQQPTVLHTIEKMSSSHWIHFACHGEANKKLDPHSAFEGILKLAPDEKHPDGYLYAQEIASLSLRANLVFMSACFSGRGKLQQEGSIGPVWSFLAAGAKSTIATYWGLPETELTVQMVETFYRHFAGKEAKKLNKAQALQQAMKVGIEKARENPRLWGSFFLSGLNE